MEEEPSRPIELQRAQAGGVKARSAPAVRSREPASAMVPVQRRPAARRHRYRRRHTPHFFLVISGLTAAAVVCLLNLYAYAMRSVELADIAFVAIVIAALIIFTAFFWGFFMVMNGNIRQSRLKVMVPHAAVGVLSPLFYTLNISAALDGLGSQPVTGMSVVLSVLCFVLLCIQFTMGRAVVRPERLRVIRREDVI